MIDRDFVPFDYTVAAYKKYDPCQAPYKCHALFTNNCRMTAEAEQISVVQPQEPLQPQAITTDEALPASRASSSIADPNAQSVNGNQQVASGTGAPPRHPPPLPPYPNPYTNSARNSNLYRSGRNLVNVPSGSVVLGSPTGGVQVRLDGTNNWSELARQDNTLPADAAVGHLLHGDGAAGGKDASSGGVFGFLSRKKGRGNSPKPKERGVLGKEGARVVIS